MEEVKIFKMRNKKEKGKYRWPKLLPITVGQEQLWMKNKVFE